VAARTPIIALVKSCSLYSELQALRAGATEVFAIEGSSPTLLNALFCRVMARADAEESLRQRLYIDKLITNMSMRFINLPPDRIGDEIRWALATLGQATGTDRSFIFFRSATGAA